MNIPNAIIFQFIILCIRCDTIYNITIVTTSYTMLENLVTIYTDVKMLIAISKWFHQYKLNDYLEFTIIVEILDSIIGIIDRKKFLFYVAK